MNASTDNNESVRPGQTSADTVGKAQIGRPAGLAVTKDGALLVSDDANGVIYRVPKTS